MCRVLMKYSLFVVNLIFVIIGLGLIGIGVAAIYVLDDVLQSLMDVQLNLKFLPYVVIGLGAFVFLISFCGCCGSITECQCLLITYGIIMVLLAAGKIYITVQVFTRSEYIRTSVENYVNDAFDDPQMNTTFHAVEALLKCCGKTGPGDYNYTYDGQSYVPPTCCFNSTGDISNIQDNPTCRKEDAFQRGCTTLLGETIEKWAHISGYVLIGIIVVEVLGLLFSSYVACTIGRNKKV